MYAGRGCFSPPCPVFGGTYTGYEEADAKAVVGVKQIVPLRDRIAVLAENSWAAIQGRNALKVTWDEGSNATIDSQEMMAAAAGRIKPVTRSNMLSATYESPYEAHATMEPMNCTAHMHDGVCELWAPTQSPQEVRRAVARAVEMSEDQVIVHVPLIGGGFGRRLEADYAVEAALVALAVDAPVQVL